MLLIRKKGDVGLVHVVPPDSPGRVLFGGQGLRRELFWTRGMSVPASSFSQSLSHLVTCDSGLGICSDCRVRVDFAEGGSAAGRLPGLVLTGALCHSTCGL